VDNVPQVVAEEHQQLVEQTVRPMAEKVELDQMPIHLGQLQLGLA
jgi:hypothetical protein